MLAKDLLKDRKNISSLELAKYLGKRHNHVLRDIKQEIERWFPIKDGIKEAFEETEYTTKANQLRPCYKLDLTGLEIMLYRYRDKTLLKYVSKKNVKKI